MNEIDVDVAIIGAGTAGMSAYRAASKHTDKIALIEGYAYGTTCARVGCMPSKLLIAPSEARHRSTVFSALGLKGCMPDVDGRAVMKRVREERDRFVRFVTDTVEGFKAEHRIWSTAKFIEPDKLALSNGRIIHAKRVVIATGSKPYVPDILKAAGEKLIVNDDVFEWQDLPQSLAVFGAGVVGLELGQALHRLGVRVTLIARSDSIGPLSSPEVKAYAHSVLSHELNYHPNTEVKKVVRDGEQVNVTYQGNDRAMHTEKFDYLLAATGRTPQVMDLELYHTALELDEHGVPLYDPQTMQCGDSPIFMAGDVVRDLPVLHEAADEGQLAGDNAGRYPKVVQRPRKTPLGVVFCDPQIAVVGQSYGELIKQGADFAIGSVSFEDQGRSRVMMVNQGLMHVYADRNTGCLLGAEMIGPQQEHLAHLLAWCIQLDMKVVDVLQLPFYHPVIEEGLRTALRDAMDKL